MEFRVDVYVSAVAGEAARSRTDAHADGSTFIPRKAAISRFATRTLLGNALKADRNHRVKFYSRPLLMRPFARFHFMTYKSVIGINDLRG
jgi:hypothetical protein